MQRKQHSIPTSPEVMSLRYAMLLAKILETLRIIETINS